MAAASMMVLQFLLDDTTAVLKPRPRRSRAQRMVPSYASTPSTFSTSLNSRSLRLPRPHALNAPGGSPGSPSGNSIPLDSRKLRTPS